MTLYQQISRRGFASLRKNWIGKQGNPIETSPEKLQEVAEELKKKAKQLGLGLVGITSSKKSARFDLYKKWLQNNYHGELDYMERDDRVARRENPSLILPGVRSVIMVGMVYWPGVTGFPEAHRFPPRSPFKSSRTNCTSNGQTPPNPARGLVSCYAWGVDYHIELSRRLRALGRHLNGIAGGLGRFYVDTGAVLERDFAERANLGFIGKNSLLINPRVGSGFFIGELFSTVPLPLDGDVNNDNHFLPTEKKNDKINKNGREENQKKSGKPGCGRCTKCKTACPTGAIVDDYVVDARRCISYLTIELKGSIPESLRRGMGNRVYGCDICQVVCPWNRFRWDEAHKKEGIMESGYSPLFGRVGEHVSTPTLVDLLQADEETFQSRFAKTAVKRIGRERMARNAAVALGNVGGVAELDVLQHVAQHDDSNLVREHAEWAVVEIKSRLLQDNMGSVAPTN